MTHHRICTKFVPMFSGCQIKTRDIRGKVINYGLMAKQRFYCVFKPKCSGFGDKSWYGRLGLNQGAITRFVRAKWHLTQICTKIIPSFSRGAQW